MRSDGTTTRWARAGVVVAALVAAGCVDDAPAGSRGAELASPVRLVRHGSDKCLDVEAAGTERGTVIHQWTCNGTVAQDFVLDARGAGTYRLINPHSGKCVDVAAAGTANGTRIQLWTCNGTAAQTFRVDGLGGGYSQLVNPNSGKCVDVSAGDHGDGARVQIWTCNGTSAQRWRIEDGTAPPPPPGDGDGDGDGDGLVWRNARLTWFTSYPDPGSDECDDFNGCQWAGYFAFVDGQQPESWVASHNIIAVHSRDAGEYALKTLRLRMDGDSIDATVYDMCSDSDCDGCCTRNAAETGFLIDIESYTRERFGHGDGTVEWACLDCD